jgi:hypothetical protein
MVGGMDGAGCSVFNAPSLNHSLQFVIGCLVIFEVM